MSRFEEFFGKWVVRNRWRIIAVTALVVTAAISGARSLTFNNDSRVFFSEQNPQLRAFETLEDTFTKNTTVFFALAPKNGDVFSRETLAALEELTESSWQIPYTSRVDSLTNFQHTEVEGDDLVVADLVRDGAAMSDGELERVRRIALAEPQLVNTLLSTTGHVAGVNITVLRPEVSMDEVAEVTDFARDLAARFRERHPDIDLHLTGMVPFDNAFGEASRKDMTTLIPAMFLVLMVVAGLALRSFTGTLATLVVVLVSMASAMGIAGWMGTQLNPASANAPMIILTLAVADSVHILATLFQQMRRGMEKLEAVAESLRVNLQPVFLTSATTAIGFLTMNFSDAPPFRDLGNIVALGVMAAFATSVTFLPSLLSVLPLRVRTTEEKSPRAGCDRLAEFVVRRRRALFRGSLAVAALLGVGVFNIRLHDNFLEYFDGSFTIRRATDFVTENLRGMDVIEYSLNAGESGGISEPGYLETVEKFANWYRSQPKVVHVSALTDTVKRLNRDLHGGDEAFYRLPEERDLIAQYLLLYEMSLPFGLDLNNQIDVDRSATRMVVSLRSVNTAELRAMDAQAREWLRTNAAEGMFTYGTGLSVIWAHISERNINSMLGGSAGALVLISLILVAALKSLRLGAVSLVTNVAPAFMAFGMWGMLKGEVGLGLSVVVSLTIGIVVDDTVHFLSKYRRARKEQGMEPPVAVRYAFNTVGTALWVTTAALVAGFSVLALSSFKMNADLGLMAAITISLALALDFLFLPALLMKVEGEKVPSTAIKEEEYHEKLVRYPDIVPGALSVPVAGGCCRRKP